MKTLISSISLVIIFSVTAKCQAQCNLGNQGEVNSTCKTLKKMMENNFSKQNQKEIDFNEIYVIYQTFIKINLLCQPPNEIKSYMNDVYTKNSIKLQNIQKYLDKKKAESQSGSSGVVIISDNYEVSSTH